MVRDEIVSNIDMTSPFAAGCSTILFEKDGAFIVLMYHAVVDVIVLRVEEITGPEYLGHSIVDCDKFSFS